MLGLSNEIPLSFFHLLPLSIHKNLFEEMIPNIQT